jgi:anthranilate phosphoribosyltransferase
MGVFHPDLVGIQVRVMERLGANHAIVVWGKDGMDEVSLGAATLVGELKDGKVREYEIHPEDFGLAMISNRGLRVGDADEVNREDAAEGGCGVVGMAASFPFEFDVPTSNPSASAIVLATVP